MSLMDTVVHRLCLVGNKSIICTLKLISNNKIIIYPTTTVYLFQESEYNVSFNREQLKKLLINCITYFSPNFNYLSLLALVIAMKTVDVLQDLKLMFALFCFMHSWLKLF